MFTTKQSDVFYNDQTKEMFVCKVSSISGKRCEGSDDIVYGALPIVYKINKNTNYQSIIYPKNFDTFAADNRSDLFNLLPSNYYGDNTNFATITKPLINYNKSSDRYSVTCIGRYAARADGFGILSYIFQYIDTDFYLLDSRSYVPKDKAENNVFTFKNGYLNSDFIIGGNPLRWNEEVDTSHVERVPDYVIGPTHIDYNDSLGFNLMAYCRKGTGAGSSEKTCLTGSKQSVFQWSGGYITYNPKYAAFDPNYDIRVDFTAKSFQVPSMTAYRSLQSSNDHAQPSRWIDTSTALSGLSGGGEGFCAFFYRNPLVGVVEPQGIGSTLGYAKASSVANEIEGVLPVSSAAVEGLVINDTGINGEKYGQPANCFLGVGFDIKGDFCTTSEGKEGWLSAGGGGGRWSHGKHSGAFTNTTAPCSVGIRGNRDSFTRVLTCISISTVAASAVSMHQQSANATGSDVDFQDYRIDLTHKGTRVTVYNKLTSTTDYNTILQFDLNSVKNEKGIFYSPWGGFYNQQFNPPDYPTRGTVVPIPYPGSSREPASKYPGANVPRAISKMAYTTHPGVVVPGRNTGWFDPEYPDAGRAPHDPGAPGDPAPGPGIERPPTIPVDPIGPDAPVSPELPVNPEEPWTPTYPDPGGLLPGRPPGPQYDRPRRPWQPESTDDGGIIIEMPTPIDVTPTIIPPPYDAPPTIDIEPPPVIIDIDDDIRLYPSGRTPSQGLIAPINVGLSFTTSNYASHFELLSFKVTGVRMGNPTKSIEEIDNITTVEYIEESSANLRRDLVTIPTGCPVDVKMLIKRQTLIDRITLCGTIPRWSDSEVEAKWTGITKRRNDIPGPPGVPPTVEVEPEEECIGAWFQQMTDPEAGPATGTDKDKDSSSGVNQYHLGWKRIHDSRIARMKSDNPVDVLEVLYNGDVWLVERFQPESGENIGQGSGSDNQEDSLWHVGYKLEDGELKSAPVIGGAQDIKWQFLAVYRPCPEDEEEKDYIDETAEPLTKNEVILGHCVVTKWSDVIVQLNKYSAMLTNNSLDASFINSTIGYTTTSEDKDEIEKQVWGQLFGRVEYYPQEKLSYKKAVNDQFPNGITFFRKWGERISRNNTINWSKGTGTDGEPGCYIVKGNVLTDAMSISQPGGHGAAMWHDGPGSPTADDVYAYKHHGSGIQFTNAQAWEWRKTNNIPSTQNSNLGFTEHSPQSDDSRG